MGKYLELTSSNFDEAKSGVALVDFWAPWCGPCRMLAPIIDELANEFDGKAKICKVNTDEEGDLAAQYGVRSIPTLIFFKNGEIVDADNVYVSDKVVISENVQKGDIIVVVRNGSRALIGKHAQIKAFMPNTVIGAFMTGLRSEQSSFVNALLDTSAFEKEIAKNMGATINQITGYMFSKMEFLIPVLEEQEKVGHFFRNIDNLITLHQRECFLHKEV